VARTKSITRGRTSTSVVCQLDHRLRITRALVATRDRLIESCGPNISVEQAELCERAAAIRAHLAQLDAKALKGEVLTATEHKAYVALSGSYARMLRQIAALSRQRPQHAAASTSLEDILAAHRGAAA
jgi:hypothetical protein